MSPFCTDYIGLLNLGSNKYEGARSHRFHCLMIGGQSRLKKQFRWLFSTKNTQMAWRHKLRVIFWHSEFGDRNCGVPTPFEPAISSSVYIYVLFDLFTHQTNYAEYRPTNFANVANYFSFSIWEIRRIFHIELFWLHSKRDWIQIEMFRISEPILNLGVHRKLSIQLIPIQLKLNLVKCLHIEFVYKITVGWIKAMSWI